MASKYSIYKCDVCGTEWAAHPTDTLCARYRPTEPEKLDPETVETAWANGVLSLPTLGKPTDLHHAGTNGR